MRAPWVYRGFADRAIYATHSRMRDDGPPDPAGGDAPATPSSRTESAGAHGVGDAGGRGSPGRRDAETLSIAIGARQRELTDMARRRREAGAPAADERRVRRTRARPPWRAGAIALLALVGGTGGIAGFYWALSAVTPDPPGRAGKTAPALSKSERETVERLLARLDFRVGPIDGRIDATTRAAIRRYRQYQGIPSADGRPTPRLLDNLRDVAALTDAGGDD